jgi:L-rhamnose mutarotase
MSRYVLTVDLRDDPDAITTYRDYHRRVWPEVQDSLRRAGVCSMEILIHGRRLVMILELNNGLNLRQVFADHAASHPRVQEWERLMQSLQEPVSGAPPGEWWAVMDPVFQLA